ncbi:MAG: TonB-dependent receptor plug domain-containing protein [Deltaproteobacteria bacterium]|nr:TonB-dependent receptor plug domain-containing protein [Deltaproteobacteria bacterium]
MLKLTLWMLLAPGLALGAEDPEPSQEERDEGDEEGDVVVVTATRDSRSALDVAPATGVVDARQLREGLARSVSEALAEVPGVEARNEGGVYYWNPVLRGLSGRRVVMLLEGERIPGNKPMGITGFWLDTLAVRQIEVVRGPSSVLYGTDALGGVVNVRLRDPFEERGLHSRLSARAGSNNGEASLGGGVRWASERLALSLSGRVREAEDYRDGDGEVVLNSYYGDHNLAGSAALRLGHHVLTLRHHAVDVQDVGKARTAEDAALHRLVHLPEDRVGRWSASWAWQGSRGQEAHASLYRQRSFRQNIADIHTSDMSALVTRTEKEADIHGLGGTGWALLPLHRRDELTVGL